MNVDEEKLKEALDKIGSDIVEIYDSEDNKSYLRPKEFTEEFKEKLKSIDEIIKEKEKNSHINNIVINNNIQIAPMQPIGFFYAPMMQMHQIQNFK